MELAAAGEDMKKLREIARVHIARCEAGDMQAIKELANRLDGKPIEMHETQGLQQLKVISEIVHVNLSPEELSALNETQELSAEPMRLNGIERMETAVSMKTPRGASSEPRTVGSKIGR
jgi:hypothetical protein